MNDTPTDRFLDLLAAEATQGLTEAESRELDGLLKQYPQADRDSLARAAAAADLAFQDEAEPLPPHLAAKIERQAMTLLGHETAPVPSRPRSRPNTPRSAFLGWAVAAGLGAVFLWVEMPKRPKSPQEEFAVIESLPGTQRFVGEQDGITANAVWNGEKQSGYLHVRGLPPLEPTREQYQLWIVDAARTEFQRVDGGLFDMQPDGTAIIRMNAKLPVKQVQLLAITREPSGGVVVSKSPLLVVLSLKPE